MAFHRTRRHEVVAGAFGRGLREERRLDVDEAVVVEVVAEGLGHLEAQLEVLLHLRTAQIEHAVGQARRFTHRVVVELEGRRQRGIDHFEIMAEHFNAARDERGVLGALGTGTHQTHDLEAELVAHFVGGLEDFRTIRIADDLHETFAVTQVDEDHPAVVAAAVGPPVEGDSLTDVLFIDQATVNGTHRCSGV